MPNAILLLMNITLDKFGRIVIPKAVRRRLGLRAGAELRLEVGDRRVVLEPVAEEPPLVEKDGILVSTSSLEEDATSFDVVEWIRAQRRGRLEEYGGRS